MSATLKSASEWIDDAVAEIQSAEWAGQESLVIWGGSFPDNQWPDFLRAWQTTLQDCLPWLIEETASQTVVRKAATGDAALPEDAYFVERLRCFGPHGDLDVRRDRECFHWRFIGDRGETWPKLPDGMACHDFWQEQPEGEKARFRVVLKRYYQWRRNDGRVSSVWFGELSRGSDLYLEQTHYLQGGQTAFVRCSGFSSGNKEG